MNVFNAETSGDDLYAVVFVDNLVNFCQTRQCVEKDNSHLRIPMTNAKLAMNKSPSNNITSLPSAPSSIPRFAIMMVLPVPPLPEVMGME